MAVSRRVGFPLFIRRTSHCRAVQFAGDRMYSILGSLNEDGESLKPYVLTLKVVKIKTLESWCCEALRTSVYKDLFKSCQHSQIYLRLCVDAMRKFTMT